jgi:hypothetical protein
MKNHFESEEPRALKSWDETIEWLKGDTNEGSDTH